MHAVAEKPQVAVSKCTAASRGHRVVIPAIAWHLVQYSLGGISECRAGAFQVNGEWKAEFCDLHVGFRYGRHF